MTQRERKASGGATTAVTAAAVPVPVGVDPLRWLPSGAGSAGRLSVWEEWYRCATPAQRAELLALAGGQGFLYAHQVPRRPNGKRPVPISEAGGIQQVTNLLDGLGDLPSVWGEPLSAHDRALDRHQQEAVARALATPDLCLIAGLPGTGKSRVVAELLTQSAQRGERILFLAPRPAAIDRALEQIADRDVVYPLRCLETGEKPESLPEAVRGLTFAEHVQKVRAALPAAVRGQELAELRCQRRRNEEALWPSLRELAASGQQLEQQRLEFRTRLSQVAGAVAQDAAAVCADLPPQAEGTFAAGLLAEQRRHQETMAAVNAALAEVEQTRAEHVALHAARATEVQALSPLARAKQQGRWWSPAWWRATIRGKVVQRLATLEEQLQAAQAALAAIEEDGNVLGRNRQELEKDHQTALNHLLQAEIGRRQSELAARESALNQAWDLLGLKWKNQVLQLELESVRPTAMTVEAVESAHGRWRMQWRADEESYQFAGRWASFLQESSETLSARLPALANVVAGTISALAGDKHFGEATPSFDLLVLEEANQITEAEFLTWARRARRWVLVGEPAWDGIGQEPAVRGQRSEVRGQRPEGKGQDKARAELRAQVAPVPADFFQRLWQHYRCDLRHLPCAWVMEGERLCCRLKALAPEQRQRLESERVADFPDIELRILTLPNARPVLAEVVFPPAMTLAQAKEYIYKELQELPIQTSACSGCWLEEPDRFIFHLAEERDRPATVVTLEHGVREVLVAGDGSAGLTCRLEFDKKAGWHRASVENWLRNHLQLRDPGRVVSLQVPYRMQPELSEILADLLFGGAYSLSAAGRPAPELNHIPQAGGNGHACPLVFVPVPSLRRGEGRSPAGKNLPREGAGLELDLGGPRPGDRLPPDLRADLPGRGFVNYLEAQAVVRRLEELVQDPALLRAARPAIAVLALYAGQVELIRRLIRRSARLGQSPVPLEVGLPSAFCHREFPIVLVSLTRSHSFRAVSFGEESSHVLLALTRARTQVILFGDPGTLVRRSQWQGRLDHLDEAAAGREGLLVNHLVRYLQGRGKHTRAFHLCEGCP